MSYQGLSGIPAWARLVTLGAVGVLVAFALAACGSEPPRAPAAPAATSAPAANAAPAAPATGSESDTIKVGILHSLSGTMAISETAVHDAELLAIEEINANGGVMGKEIEVVIEDGASDWPTFAEKARKLLQEDEVSVVFRGLTTPIPAEDQRIDDSNDAGNTPKSTPRVLQSPARHPGETIHVHQGRPAERTYCHHYQGMRRRNPMGRQRRK